MAKIYEEIIVIKLSRLVKDTDNTTLLATDEIVASLEQVTQELIGDTVIVEVERT
jgi:hypothetical protein